MGFFSKFFGGDPEKVYKTCVDIYEKAKRKRPGKPERDYLKLVLLTKPPYDYQRDEVIDLLLDEYENIDEIADFIACESDPYNRESLKTSFECREENLKFYPEIKDRNRRFFEDFWE